MPMKFSPPIMILIMAFTMTSPYVSSAAPENQSTFSFHLLSEVHSLDPARINGSSGAYLFANVYRGLFRYSRKKGLIPEGAKSCRWRNDKILECQLSETHVWSNGEPVVAQDYVRAFQHLVAPKTMTVLSESLLPLKNAKEILGGQLDKSLLGIKALAKDRLEFTLHSPNLDFLFELASPVLTPIKSEEFGEVTKANAQLVTGPYRFKEWHVGKRILLEPNPYYKNSKIKNRPMVTAHFIEDDQTARRLYDAGELKFLRRVIVQDIPLGKKDPEFFQIPMARFDYVGFGPQLRDQPALREAMILSLNYPELKTLLHSLGDLGCPSLPSSYFDKVTCYRFDLKRAKELLSQVPKEFKSKPIRIWYSEQGGDDIKTQVQWIQNQWKTNLGLDVVLEGWENKMYLAQLKSKPPEVFRKGVGLDRPTCLAALEVMSAGHTENYLDINDPAFEGYLNKLKKVDSAKQQKIICSQALNHLMGLNLFIPLGEMHFSMLAKPQFSGWEVNEINQLDLTDLVVQSTMKKRIK